MAYKNNALHDMESYFENHRIVHLHQWYTAIRTDWEAKKIHRSMTSRINYHKLQLQLVDGIRLSIESLPFAERVQKIADIPADTVLYENIKNFCVFQNIPLKDIFACMCGKFGKRKTIYCVGPPNAGKTFFLNFLACIYESFEIGRLSPAGIQSEFWLQDLCGKELYVGDEILVSQLNIDTLKLLFEGNPNLCTDIKFGVKQQLLSKPVLVACNNELTLNMPSAYDAIVSRCIRIEFKSGFEFPSEIYSTKDYQYVLRKLFMDNKI